MDSGIHTQAPATEENVALLGDIEQRKKYLHVFAVARRRDKRAKMVESSVRTIATAKGKRSETGFKSWAWMCREHGEAKMIMWVESTPPAIFSQPCSRTGAKEREFREYWNDGNTATTHFADFNDIY